MIVRTRFRHYRRSALSISATYSIAASVWILGSDLLVRAVDDHATVFNTVKEILFVILTSVGLYFLVRSHFRKITAAETVSERAERLQRLGVVAAKISHDFNNVLMTCGLFASVLERSAGDDRSRQAVAQIKDAVRRRESLTREVLTFARPHRPAFTRVPVSAVLENLAREIAPHLESISLELKIEPEDLVVRADPDHLHRIMMNLITNATQAMPEGGKLTLRARGVRATRADELEGMTPRDRVEISVTDTGSGISPEILPHIFEPMITTKRTGTGLGLAIVQRLVQDQGGDVSVKSRVGEGTTMSILLPSWNDKTNQNP